MVLSQSHLHTCNHLHVWSYCLQANLQQTKKVKLSYWTLFLVMTCSYCEIGVFLQKSEGYWFFWKSHWIFCFCLRPSSISWYSIQSSLSEPFREFGSQILALLCIPHLFLCRWSLTWNSWSYFVFVTRAMNIEEVSSAL